MTPNKAIPRKRGQTAKLVVANARPKRPNAIPGPARAPASATFLSTIELLNDLTNFCGVGSLEIQMPRRAAVGMEAPDGWLWLESPAYKCPKVSVEANLQELVDHGVMRCTYLMVTGSIARVRVYVLPDDVGRSMIQRDDPNLRKWRKVVMATMDMSIDGWAQKGKPLSKSENDKLSLFTMSNTMDSPRPENDKLSLFTMFNTMDSPRPDPESPWIKDENTKDLLRSVLAPNKILGMKTTLYKYQKRSVALMLQKELAPERTRDPRLKEVFAPTGEIYYLDSETMEVFQEPRYYEDVRGGILAEEMGTGKTLICLAVILASKHQVSSVPEEYAPPPLLRKSVASLCDMCVTSIWQNAIPWTQYLDLIPENCVKKIKENHGFYEAPQILRSRSSRYSYDSNAMEKIYLGTGTIIVCPQNLVKQWEDEINKHIEESVLKVLIIAKYPAEIPSVFDLLGYDIILFSRPCFDAEAREGRDAHGRTEFYGVPPVCRCTYKGSTRTRQCVCFKKEAVYKSPLMSIQWKRLIVDEGHSMASSGAKSNGVCVAERLSVERRWIVTGTPTSELVGIMPGMVADESEVKLKEGKECRINEELHLDRIGKMVGDFLRQKPWAPMDDRRNTERAHWKRYISKGSNSCVRSIFQRLFIRHRPEDIEEDVALPRLEIKEVWLHPGFYEKVSMNLLLGALAVNAVTSERSGGDYIFHPSSGASLKRLTDNLLKRSGFYFSGYSVADVADMVENGRNYLMKHSMAGISSNDRQLLNQAIVSGEMALGMRTWREISIHRDMVYFLSDFPEQLAPVWSFLPCEGARHSGLLEMDGSQVQNLQKSINAHASELDITSKLRLVGNDFHVARQRKLDQTKKSLPIVPRQRKLDQTKSLAMRVIDKMPPQKDEKSKTAPPKSALKKSKPVSILPPDSPLAKARIIGTASRKLTYLLNKIMEHHKTEKTLIFFESHDVTMCTAQALEILGIEHLWYSGSLSQPRRASHLSAFQNSEKYRVLLMDLSQAAHGLNVSCASRVFFVNPVWRRDIEQQAMKRAHRIGQTKTVYVETLILADTIEEAMWKRRGAMTGKERDEAKGGLIEDSKMRDIISNLQFLRVGPSEGVGIQQVSALAVPEPIFGDGKHGGVYDEIEHFRPSSPTAPSTPSVRWESSSSTTAAGESNERVVSDLPTAANVPNKLVVSDLSSARVRWMDETPPRDSRKSSRMRKSLDTFPVASSGSSAGLSASSTSSNSSPEVSVESSAGVPSGKRKVPGASSAVSNECLAGRPVKRKKRMGFKAGDDKDWMEDSDDDFGAPADANGNSKGQRDVRFE